MGPSTRGSCSAAWVVAWVAGMIARAADTWAAARAAQAARVAQAAGKWAAGQEGGKQAAWAD